MIFYPQTPQGGLIIRDNYQNMGELDKTMYYKTTLIIKRLQMILKCNIWNAKHC
jgi:hypothetical protein